MVFVRYVNQGHFYAPKLAMLVALTASTVSRTTNVLNVKKDLNHHQRATVKNAPSALICTIKSATRAWKAATSAQQTKTNVLSAASITKSSKTHSATRQGALR